MCRRLVVTACIGVVCVAGCQTARHDLKPIALSGTEIVGVQSKYQALSAVPEFYTSAAEVKIDFAVEGAKPARRQTVLWYRQQEREPWRRGPASQPGERWIAFAPREGRYACRASVINSDGTEDFQPGEGSLPAFMLVVDRSPPLVLMRSPVKVYANTTTTVAFEVWDPGLLPTPTADLSFSADGGATWEPVGVIPITAGESSYNWAVPDRPGSTNLLRLTVRDMAGNQTTKQGEEPFAILPHPTPGQAIERFFQGVTGTTPETPPTPGEAAPPPSAASAPPAPPAPPVPAPQQGGQAALPAEIMLEAPPAGRPGESVEVRVGGLPAGATPPPLRLSWRASAAGPWQPLDVAWSGAACSVALPAGETLKGAFRVEALDAAGAPASAATTGDIVVDGTPPEVVVEAVPAADGQLYRVRAQGRDAGAGTAWVKLFATRDGGRSWQEVATKAKDEIEYEARPEQVELGFAGQSQDRVGNATTAPAPGSAPASTVPARPTFQAAINDLGREVLPGGGRTHVTWQTSGAVPPGTAAALAMRQGSDGIWRALDAVDLGSGRYLWELPRETLPAVYLRLELRPPNGAAIASAPMGPIAIDHEPPRIALDGTAFCASSLIRIPIVVSDAGPAPLAGATLLVRRPGGTAWQPLRTTYERAAVSAPSLLLPEGAYEVFVQARDAAGNEGPAPTAATAPLGTLTVDRTPPQLTLAIAGALDEGVPGAIDISTTESATTTLFLAQDGDRAEIALATFRLPAGSSTHRFRPPPGLAGGTLWARAVDDAGNRAETEETTVTARSSLRFIAPHGGEAFTAGDQIAIEYWVGEGLLAERPELRLWHAPAGEGSRQAIPEPLPLSGSFAWTVPDRPGAGQSLRIEARTAGVVAAVADLSGTFEIRRRERSPAATPPKVPDIAPESAARADEGNALVDALAEAQRTNARERAAVLRLQAEARFRAAIGYDQRNAEAYWGLARLYLAPLAEREDLARAEEYLASAVQANPAHHGALVRLGVTRLKLKRYPEAEAAFAQALNIKDDPTVRYNLGLALMKQDKYAPAVETFRRAVDGTPPVTEAYLCMIDCLTKQENYVKAKELLAEAAAKQALPAAKAQEIEAFLDGKIAERG